MISAVKEKKISFLERTFTKQGTILDIRPWASGTFFEVDLHLPDTDMSKWTVTQHIKCKVAPYTFRDYTPAQWDASTHTCTLFIDAAHDGAGARWAQQLQTGELLVYLGIGSSMQKPVQGQELVFLGDQSALAHFLALQQLAGNTAQIKGNVVIKDPEHVEEFNSYFPRSPFQPVLQQSDALSTLVASLLDFPFSQEQVFYLVGNVRMVADLRNLLRKTGINSSQIKAQGFWK
ncbi:NADPH-dependent ferric siderophore reductase [Chitinophaga terrae (ex Kim and Jung 2007)]|uniref:siderophore-interacting protein n=1 Tax=Chitinophaga terrae (ex Kim and Jung 2007) TaxID=408074 RepID=UPI00277EBE1A|nr:SIP domain-containing protein [Chitinophaga terrae (ex Kim and Jung 2007)]MDQ0107393.1 NADPH-dependent ferric siderophore reductase [Chitinophaga terrae (ex Kim and Jung 2007)]